MKFVKRQHIHFPGFEPLSSAQHYRRFVKGAEKASEVWGNEFQVSEFDENTESFSINAHGKNWEADTNIFIAEISERILDYGKEPLIIQLIKGYRAFFDILFNAALFGYFKHAWRFGFFAIVPFALIGIGLFEFII